MRIRAAATLTATIAAAVLASALIAHATEPVQGTPHAAVSVCETDGECAAWGQAHGVQPGYGVAEDTSDTSCWVEKATSVDTAEAICGARGQRPAGALDLGSVVVLDGQVWVATLGGLDPVGAN